MGKNIVFKEIKWEKDQKKKKKKIWLKKCEHKNAYYTCSPNI